MLLTLLNPETADLEKSYLNASYSTGITSVMVKNSDRFAADDRIMIGEMGQEKTEVVTVSAVASDGQTLTIGATEFSHEADTPVYKLRFDQARFYRSTTTSTGTYTLLATVNLDVDNANLSTLYDDDQGQTTYYYKMTVYHSISTLESAFSDPIGGAGWRRDQVGNIIDEILQEVSDTNEQHITRNELLGYFNDVNDDLQGAAARPFDFLRTRTSLTRTAATNYIDFPTDSDGRETMWKFDRMDYNYTDSDTDADMTYTLRVVPEEKFRNTYQDNTVSTTSEDDATQVISLDTAMNRFRFYPRALTTAANAFYLYYWKYFTQIDSEGDIIETPTAKIYKLYCKAMYYTKRSTVEFSHANTADRFMQQYEMEKRKLQMANRRDVGTPRSFRQENSVTKSFRR